MTIETDSIDETHKRNKRSAHHRSAIPAEEGSHPLPNLPHEIIVEILTRLPVKSLLRFRSVCKSWLSLISDPQFVQTHLSLASKTDDCSTRLIFRSSHPNLNLKSCSLYSVLYEQSHDVVVELDFPWEVSCRCVLIAGSCNGLVCISIGDSAVILWNPSTRKSKQLPDERDGRVSAVGFGHDEANDDYKAVKILRVRESGGSFETEMKVYSLRTDSWRRIANIPFAIPTYGLGKFVNGSLHWVAWDGSKSSSARVIVSLDLAKETHREVAQPIYNDGDDKFRFTLGVLKGNLGVLYMFFGIRSDVWVMKEYGKAESWTKLFSIPYVTIPRNYDYSPLCISKNGEILLKCGTRPVLYNSKDLTCRYPVIIYLHTCLDMHTYVESLVSPYDNNVVRRQHQYHKVKKGRS